MSVPPHLPLSYNPFMLPTLLETLMPVFDVAARRSICIDAPAERVYQAARALPLMKTGLARRLLALRAAGASGSVRLAGR